MKNRTKKFLDVVFKDTLIEYDFAESEISEGISIRLYTRKHPDNELIVIPWLRPESMTTKQLTKNLGNYPRLNITKKGRSLPDEEKIPYMLQKTKRHNVYFLIILPRTIGEPLFWLERYNDIPADKWKLTYRKDPKKKDRILLTKYKEPHFIVVKELQKQINKLLKNGN